MKTLVSPASRSKISRTAARRTRFLSAIRLIILGLLLAATSSNAALKIAPFVSYIPDQAITNSATGFRTQYFRILELQPPPNNNGFMIMKESTNAAFYDKNNVKVEQCTTQVDFDARVRRGRHRIQGLVSCEPHGRPGVNHDHDQSKGEWQRGFNRIHLVLPATGLQCEQPPCTGKSA